MALNRGLGLWLPPLALMGVIYFFSAQPDLSSGLGFLDLVLRKVVHFAEYALLCVLGWRALRTRTSAGRAVVLAFVISSAYAATDEFHQTFVEGRDGLVLDVVIDALAAAVAVLAIRRRITRRATATR